MAIPFARTGRSWKSTAYRFFIDRSINKKTGSDGESSDRLGEQTLPPRLCRCGKTRRKKV